MGPFDLDKTLFFTFSDKKFLFTFLNIIFNIIIKTSLRLQI